VAGLIPAAGPHHPPENPRAAIWSDAEARFHAEALDGSDYGQRIGAALATALPAPGSLLDLGAGAGHPVQAWLPPQAHWTALEPNAYLRGRLLAHRRPLMRVLDALWQEVPQLGLLPHDLAFCANISGPLEAPRALLDLMRAHASHAVAWVVPAQRGPRRWCLAGALPAALHGEGEEPAVEQVLAALGPERQPSRQTLIPWSFQARFASLAAAAAYCATRLPAAPPDAIAAHLATTAEPLAGGAVRLRAPKLSALLIWNLD
jgi:hypothetical protein